MVQLQRLSRGWRRCDRATADGRAVDLRQRSRQHFCDHRRRPAERHAIVSWPHPDSTSVGAHGLRALALRPAAQGRGAGTLGPYEAIALAAIDPGRATPAELPSSICHAVTSMSFEHSALDPAGPMAASIAQLWWVFVG